MKLVPPRPSRQAVFKQILMFFSVLKEPLGGVSCPVYIAAALLLLPFVLRVPSFAVSLQK